jgi:muconolactone delta-isomerase
LSSLPLFRYLTITVHPLASHPNDPMSLDRASEASIPTKLN